jgi:CxxC motif-containing protein (DUF1111 family)
MNRWRHARLFRRAAATVMVIGAATVFSALAITQSRAEYLGGDTTVFDEGTTAFGRALANLDPLRWNEFRADKARFLRQWPERGPWADAVSCAECHYHDGRGPRADQVGGPVHLVRLGGPLQGGDPIYGIQLRRTGYGMPAPASYGVEWEEIRDHYPDGDSYALRRPTIHVSELAYGPLDPRTRLSLRVPLAVFGLGLLEALPDHEIRGFADPDDVDGDGVSGVVQEIRDAVTGRSALGRFGWKASQPSLVAQSAAALMADLGVIPPGASHVTDRVPGKSLQHEPEIDDGEVMALVRYMRALAVPARRQWTRPVVREGEVLFEQIGCTGCHRRQIMTGELPGWPELTRQSVQPFTDLLLHDMGPQLADAVSEGLASGSEWRTPPLWGLGLLPTVGGQSGLLHDGRARSPEEAILWHGGEAERARERFKHLPRERRTALLEFLKSL